MVNKIINEMDVPKFVKLDNIALRLINESYYRDGGEWSVGFKIINGVLLSWSLGHRQLHRRPLVEITEDEWREDNKQYIPNYLTENKDLCPCCDGTGRCESEYYNDDLQACLTCNGSGQLSTL